MGRKDYAGVDIARFLGFFSVFVIHFLEASAGSGGLSLLGSGTYSLLLDVIGLSGAAVELFFIVSGFCLAGNLRAGHSTAAGAEREKVFSVRDFYRKRFFRLLIPLYVLFVIFALLSLVRHTFPQDVINMQAPVPTALYSLLGLDGLLMTRGYTTFTSFYIGEWFLGVLILLMLFFPLLRIAVQKNRIITLAVSFILYLVFLRWQPFGLGGVASFLVQAFPFVLGMFLASAADDIKLRYCLPVFLLAGLALAAAWLFPGFFRTPAGERCRVYKITLFATAIFLLLLCTEKQLARAAFLRGPLKAVRRYSYAFFLVHHPVLTRVIGRILTEPYTAGKLALAFGISFAAAAAGAYVLDRLCQILTAPRKAR